MKDWTLRTGASAEGPGSMGADAPFDPLSLENQLCFPLYAAAKGVVRSYAPALKRIDLTYTQYIAMMVLWETPRLSVNDLGRRLHLDSGTLTPVLKKLETKGLVTRERDADDERRVIVKTTQSGRALREEALQIPAEVGRCITLSFDEACELRRLLDKVLACVESE